MKWMKEEGKNFHFFFFLFGRLCWTSGWVCLQVLLVTVYRVYTAAGVRAVFTGNLARVGSAICNWIKQWGVDHIHSFCYPALLCMSNFSYFNYFTSVYLYTVAESVCGSCTYATAANKHGAKMTGQFLDFLV